ncbi:MAG: hypothetical protein C0606_14720 [Hyphomicrobiales bacterium]|nr:MAG: hypothetical protein C0606_14720 [Hyphomicrobiales bacterium]
MSKLTRRVFLGLAGVGTIAVVGYGGTLLACRFVPRNTPDFFAGLDDEALRAAARGVGERVLAMHPELIEDVALDRFLEARPLLQTAANATCPGDRRSLLQDQCAADFAAGEVRVLDGWVLSETEIRLCGAAAKYA